MSLENWRAMGEVLRVRMRVVKAQRSGGAFPQRMRVWLQQNGFDTIDKVARCDAKKFACAWPEFPSSMTHSPTRRKLD